MKISQKSWLKYIEGLGKLSKEAEGLMRQRLIGIDLETISSETRRALISYAYSLIDKYGGGASELACEMYDALAEASNAFLPASAPASLPEYKEVAKAINGTIKLKNPDIVSQSVSRLVKRTGVDTTMQNAIRDGAEWAWVPSGDTCAFCLTLASRGWQKASKKALKNGHAEHIHAHCDCTYAVRFDHKSSVEGYEPDKYLAQYNSAEGYSPQEKINSLRRNIQRNKEKKARSLVDVTGEYIRNSKKGIGSYKESKGYIVTDVEEHKRKVNASRIIIDNLGGDIMLLPEVDIEWPDILWKFNGDEKYWEIKSISTEKAANSALRKGLRQINNTKSPGGIILYSQKKNLDKNLLDAVITERMQWYKGNSMDIIIIEKESVKRALRY